MSFLWGSRGGLALICGLSVSLDSGFGRSLSTGGGARIATLLTPAGSLLYCFTTVKLDVGGLLILLLRSVSGRCCCVGGSGGGSLLAVEVAMIAELGVEL